MKPCPTKAKKPCSSCPILILWKIHFHFRGKQLDTNYQGQEGERKASRKLNLKCHRKQEDKWGGGGGQGHFYEENVLWTRIIKGIVWPDQKSLQAVMLERPPLVHELFYYFPSIVVSSQSTKQLKAKILQVTTILGMHIGGSSAEFFCKRLCQPKTKQSIGHRYFGMCMYFRRFPKK